MIHLRKARYLSRWLLVEVMDLRGWSMANGARATFKWCSASAPWCWSSCFASLHTRVASGSLVGSRIWAWTNSLRAEATIVLRRRSSIISSWRTDSLAKKVSIGSMVKVLLGVL
ncbi:hypothetical protein F5X96DRAFT_613464 [Biscogniauxia mediterranea]|nr:hypothetical protein F5X96DRAFT_613464 [Biscogniauxia mediterranea]